MRNLESKIIKFLLHWLWTINQKIHHRVSRKRTDALRFKWRKSCCIYTKGELAEKISDQRTSVYTHAGVDPVVHTIVKRMKLGHHQNRASVIRYFQHAWLEAFDRAYRDEVLVTEKVFSNCELEHIRMMAGSLVDPRYHAAPIRGLLAQTFEKVMAKNTIYRVPLFGEDLGFYAEYLLNVLWEDYPMLAYHFPSHHHDHMARGRDE